MNITLYCFSGTGNSLAIAKGLSKRLDNSNVIQVTNTTQIDTTSDYIGLVFPVYLFGAPEIMQNLIKKLPHCDKRIFAVATFKSQTGNVLGQVQKLLAINKNVLCAGYTIAMPGNNIIYYDLESEEIRSKKLINAEVQLDKLISDIESCSQLSIPKASFRHRMMTLLLNAMLTKGFHSADKKYNVTDECQGCGLCEKICSVQNIKIIDGKPTWLHNCHQCTACLNICPQKAIQFGKVTLGKERYINPNIHISELIIKER